MRASYTTESHGDGFYSIVFSAYNEEYGITFGLPGNQAMLSARSPGHFPIFQFIFECNAITFHPRANQDFYMICFHNEFGAMKSPKLLIAGDASGVTHMVQYSLPSKEIIGDLEFPRQL